MKTEEKISSKPPFLLINYANLGTPVRAACLCMMCQHGVNVMTNATS